MDNNSQPATKADLEALRADVEAFKAEIKADMKAQEHRLEGKIDVSQQRTIDRMTELVRDTETKLLQAFYSFAEANEKRVGQIEGNSAAVVGRLATLESRVLEIEKRLNMPPAS